MDSWVAELLSQIDRGEAIGPLEIRQLMEHKEGRRQLREYLAMRQLLSGWNDTPPPVPGEKPPVPLSLEQLKLYLEQGTLNDKDLDESAQRLLSARFPNSASNPIPADDALPNES